MPPRRRNPKGTWGLRAISSLLVVDDVQRHRLPPHALTSPRKTHARDPLYFHHGLLVLVPALLMLLSGCAKKPTPPIIYRPAGSPSTQPKPDSEKPPLEPVVSLPETSPKPALDDEELAPEPVEILPSSFQVGEEKFAVGSFQEAALSYEVFIKENPNHPKRDPADFKLALSYIFFDNSAQSLRRAQDQFRKFISQFPESPYRRQAEYILALQEEIDKLRSETAEKDRQLKRLAEELERLKKIDLGKLPPRPPH
jgi:hypothetical protein